MSVLMAKDDPNSVKHSAASNNIREKSPRLKNNMKVQASRDSVKIVNEKNAANLQVCADVEVYINHWTPFIINFTNTASRSGRR